MYQNISRCKYELTNMWMQPIRKMPKKTRSMVTCSYQSGERGLPHRWMIRHVLRPKHGTILVRVIYRQRQSLRRACLSGVLGLQRAAVYELHEW